MLTDFEKLRDFENVGLWLVAFVGVLLAAVALLPRLSSERKAHLAGWGGLIVAAIGLGILWVQSRADRAEAEWREAKPIVVAELKAFAPSNLCVVVESKNRIPFECQFMVCNSARVVLSGVPLEWAKFNPTKENPQCVFRTAIDFAKLQQDNEVYLTFDYRSTASRSGLPAQANQRKYYTMVAGIPVPNTAK